MMTTTAADETTFERVPSGIAGLDTILGGGFMGGGIYIIQGEPGAGKTILTNQICFQLLAENHARMMGNLRGLAFFEESKIPDRLTYLSAFRELREGGLKGLGDLLRREIQRRRCSLLVLDGLVSVQAIAASAQAFRSSSMTCRRLRFQPTAPCS
jgi:circadian clock protein KaiC